MIGLNRGRGALIQANCGLENLGEYLVRSIY